MAVTIQETYSSTLVNYVESHIINGVSYTRFYTEINTDLSVGDYVYIHNGNYDNSDIVDLSVYRTASNGYKILAINKNTLTLDILYREETPWNSDNLEDFTKVYLVDSLTKFNYENQDNGFGYVTLGGHKYSTENNNIMLSQIENMPYTTETQTNNKFFKSYLEENQPLILTGTKGQIFASGTTLSFVLEENLEHNATNSIGDSTSVPTDYTFFGDFDIGNHDSEDYLVGLIATGPSASLSKLWYWDKTSNVSTSVNNNTGTYSGSTTATEVHYIKLGISPGTKVNISKDIMTFDFPNDMSKYNQDFTISHIRGGGGSGEISISDTVDIYDLGSTILAGYSATSSHNRTVGFYSKSDSVEVPSGENQDWTSATASGYSSTTGTASPYFVLSGTANGYTPTNQYWPYGNNIFGIVPTYSLFTGIGKLSKSEVNDYVNQNPNEGNVNVEIAFSGQKRAESSDNINKGGMYLHSYSSNYAIGTDVSSWTVYLGNSLEINRNTYDLYDSIAGLIDSLNPFEPNLIQPPIDNIDEFFDIKDFTWLGVEKRNFGITLEDSTGIYYSKYLLTTKAGVFWLYVYFNGAKLRHMDLEFDNLVIGDDIPQVHWKITRPDEPMQGTLPGYPEYYDVIGVNKLTSDADLSPQRIAGNYPLGRAELSNSLVEYFDKNIQTGELEPDIFGWTSSLNSASITNFDFHNNRWLVSTSNHTPRLDTHFGTTSSFTESGIFIMDRTIGGNIFDMNLTVGHDISAGVDIPSNNVFKVMGESIGLTSRRVWAATEEGLYMYEYDLEFDFNYYYSIDFNNNVIPLDNDTYRNGRFIAMEDFTFDGINYEKGKIYRYLASERRWIIDETYLQSFLSKSHFKDGTFEDGTFDDGIFGNRTTQASWIGAEWRNGLSYNSDWTDGIMTSKSDELVSQSYYAKLKNGSVKLTTDFTNNSTFGYNFMFGSIISGGQINNGNFYDTQVGTQSTSLLETVYAGNTYSYEDITVNKGYYNSCNIISVEMDSSRIQNSIINNSRIDEGSNILNTEVNSSIISDATIQNKGIIKILDYDKWYNLKETINGIDVIHIHKFFVNENDFNEITYGDWVIFNNLNTTSGDPITIFDELFYVLGGTAGFYDDVYDNLNVTIKTSGTGDTEYEQVDSKIFISKKLKDQNSEKTTAKVNPNGSGGILIDINKATIPETNRMYSIDLSIIVDTIPHGSSLERFTDSITDDNKLKLKVNNFSRATIQTRHFKYSWLNGGTWLNGSIINPPQLSRWYNDSLLRVTGTNLQHELTNSNYEITHSDVLDLGTSSVVYIDNLYNNGFTMSVDGNYVVNTINTSDVVLTPLGTELNGIPVSTDLYSPLSHRSNVYLNRIDGVGESLTIQGGYFRRQYFSNTTIDNPKMDNSNDFRFNNIRNLMIVQNQMTNDNNNIVNNGYFGFSHITNDYSNDTVSVKIISHKSAFLNATVEGTLTRSSFLSGTFSDGVFINNKYQQDRDIIPTNNETYLTTSEGVIPGFHSGTFSNGIFDKSIWLNGSFVNGSFVNSEFLGGTWSNGTFGDKSSKSTLNVFRKGLWKNGIFQNGIFGDNSDYVENVNSIYSSGDYIINGNTYSTVDYTNIWESGNFNNGIFTNINNGTSESVSIFKGGKFNNGMVSGQVIWENDSIFNNGKFYSDYGKHLPYVLTAVDLQSAETDSYSASTPNMRLVDLYDTYGSTMSFITKLNFGSHGTDTSINDLQIGTLILDTSDWKLKFGFLSSGTASQSPTQQHSRAGYTEYYLDQFFSSPTSSTYYLIFDDVDQYEDHPLYQQQKIGTLLIDQTNNQRYVYNGATYTPEATFLNSTIPGTSLTYSSIYAWRDGVFNNGEFGSPEGINSPSWENGTFNGGYFYGKIWKSGNFVSGTFNGSGVSQSSTSNTVIHEGYNAQDTISNYKSEIIQLGVGTISNSQMNYKNVQNDPWHGLWLDGNVVINENQNTISESVTVNKLVDYFNEDKYNRKRKSLPKFIKSVWVSGTFENSGGIFSESIFLSGNFLSGLSKNSLFNPYVERWDFENGYTSNSQFKFEKDLDLCVFNGGVIDGGVIYYSNVNGGVVEDGTSVGVKFGEKVKINYISAYNSIIEGSKWRNGNFYGSGFSLKNKFNDPSVSNPFSYLGQRFRTLTNGDVPYFLDITGKNSIELQTEEIHVWNCFTGSTNESVGGYDMTTLGHNFGSDTDSTITISDDSATSGDLSGGTISILLQNSSKPNTNSASIILTDSVKLQNGEYEFFIWSNIDFTGTRNYFLNYFVINGTIKVLADRFDGTTGFFKGNKIIQTLSGNGYYNNISVVVPNNEEWRLYLDFDISSSYWWSSGNYNIYLSVETVSTDVEYNTNNNTLNGIIGLSWSGDIFGEESTFATISATYAYTDGFDIEHIITTEEIDIVTFSVPNLTQFSAAGGAYTMFGNGSFIGDNPIFESGVWNNGWRGEYGYYKSLIDTGLTVSLHDGSTMSVVSNPLFVDSPKAKRRTPPSIYFNGVSRFYKINSDTWEIILESSYNINGENFEDDYNRLNVGDVISISNLIVETTNNDEKVITDTFVVIDIPSNRQITIRYRESFPIFRIGKDSERHTIVGHKNVWLNGVILNGYFEGVFNNSLVHGNVNTTKFEHSSLINTIFEGGHFVSEKLPLTNAYDNTTSTALLLNPEFDNKYNSTYHTSLIQSGVIDASDELELFSVVNPREVTLSGSSGYRVLSYSGGTSSGSTAIKYLYNTHMDLIWEYHEFSSIFNQNVFNSHFLNNSNIDTSSPIETKIYNTPLAGPITNDILRATTKLKYSTLPTEIDEQELILELGSKYKLYNTIYEADFGDVPENNTSLFGVNIASPYNIIDGASFSIHRYGIDFGEVTPPSGIIKGIDTLGEYKIDVHENFIYNINDNNDRQDGQTGYQGDFILSADNSFNIRSRYHVVEAEVQFIGNSRSYLNPYNPTQEFTINTTYSYSATYTPRLSFVNHEYNRGYTYYDGSDMIGYLPYFYNDVVPFIDGRINSELNMYGNLSPNNNDVFTIRSYGVNNHGGHRDSIRLLQRDFGDGSGSTSSTYTINSPAYKKLKHSESQRIPFFNFMTYDDHPTHKQWSIFQEGGSDTNQGESRSINRSVKIPFYGTSQKIVFSNNDPLLISNINLSGGTNIRSNFIFIQEEDTPTTGSETGGGAID